MNTIDPLVTADDTLHIELPPEISDRVEVIVMSASDRQTEMPEESLIQAKLMDESGFAKNVLGNADEDCWNDL